MNNHYDNLCDVARHYGADAQTNKAVEEFGELVAALSRKKFDGANGIYSEMADAYNMLDQLCILWNCEETVQLIAEQKMERQIKRIENEVPHEEASNGYQH